MNATNLMIAPDAVERPPVPASSRGRTALGRGLCVALACALLAVAGALRWWQERRVLDVLAGVGAPPFPLADLPTHLGPWRITDEGELELDPEVERILGCTDYIRRIYLNDQIGVRLELLVLYGPATVAHRPDLCYPGAGYEQVDGPRTRTVEVPGRAVAYDSLVFEKGEGSAADRQQVSYSLRYGGRWTPETNQKEFGRMAGMYKIQLARRIGAHERLDAGTPSEAFLDLMLPEIERRIAAGDTPASPPRTEAPR